jgi:hypothetical protein
MVKKNMKVKLTFKAKDSRSEIEILYEQYCEENKETCSTRDCCGQCAYELVQLFEVNGIEAFRVQGQFKLDNPVQLPLDLNDLFKEEKKKFVEKHKGILHNKDELSQAIFDFATEEGFINELYFMPHYWVEVEDTIFDPSISQFDKAVNGEITEDNYVRLER